MKHLIIASLLFCCFNLLTAQNQTKSVRKKTKYIVSGIVLQISPFCGGMKPSEEMLKNIQTPKPYIGKKFYVRKGNTNSIDSPIVLNFTVDSTGKFSFRLSPGTYSIIQEEQVKPVNANSYETKYISVDESCLNDWWAKPYYLLEVKKKNIQGLTFTFYHRCFISSDIPCLQYTGPLPP